MREGSTMTLECLATGNPEPIITWKKESSVLPNGDKFMNGPAVQIGKIHEVNIPMVRSEFVSIIIPATLECKSLSISHLDLEIWVFAPPQSSVIIAELCH